MSARAFTPVRVRRPRADDSGDVSRVVGYRRRCDYCDWHKAFPTVRKLNEARALHMWATHGRAPVSI